MKTDAEREQEMVESPGYRLGTAIAIIESLLDSPEGMRPWCRRRAEEFLRDEEARAARFSGKA